MREVVTHDTARLQSAAAIDSFVLKRRMQIEYVTCIETQLKDLCMTDSTGRNSEDQ
jgi:hypothetical protein